MLEKITLSKINEISDWLELSCLFDDIDDSISRSELYSYFDEKDIVDEDDIDETIDAIYAEIKYRQYVANNLYPFKIENNCIVRKIVWVDNLAYAFMLLLSTHSLYEVTEIPRGGWYSPSKLFEKIVTSSLRADFNRAINIGSPRARGHIRKFPNCVRYLVEVTNEPIGPSLGATGREQDESADIIAWKRYDNRSGQVIILVQCASGEEKVTKRKELRVRAWRDVINFTVDPLLGYAIPHIITDNSEWFDISYDGGIIYDRLRIISLLPEKFCSNKTNNEIYQWSKNQVKKLPFIEK
ncbi:MAG: hypothetical protein ACTSU6_06690 [Candidatus Njordarchaeales archaeon]